MIKIVGLIQRNKDLTHEGFRERWKDHVSVVEELPGLHKYNQLVPVDPEACPYDGIAELYFDSVEDCRAAFDSQAGDLQFEDAESFTALPGGDDFHEATKSSLLAMLFEVHTEIDKTD